MASGGRDVGSSIDVQAHMRGDFDGDGTRDVPDLTSEIRRHRIGDTLATCFLCW